ncbi:MAG: ABC transporter permease [Alphaproteobacteria bacterium]|nr:ABC transporter permease [Alphaproteobacteria bacterium]
MKSSRFASLGGWLVTLPLTIFGLLLVTFLIGRVMPIDPVIAIVGDRAPVDVYERVRLELGLDRPLYEQFWRYCVAIFHGDFGRSVMTSRPVLQDIGRFFPATLELATLATILGVAFGVPMGVFAAVRQDSWADYVIRVLGLIGHSVPVFVLGLIGLVVFYAKLNWVAGSGRINVAFDDIVDPITGSLLIDAAIQGEWEVFRNAVSHIVLPAGVLAYFSLAYIARMTRAFMLEQLRQEYVTTARVKGMSERRVIWRHAFSNISVPLITVIALSYANLLEGSVLTETIFAWPGLGQYLTVSLLNADMNAVLGATLVVGAVYLGLNLLSDLLYRIFDPRAR